MPAPSSARILGGQECRQPSHWQFKYKCAAGASAHEFLFPPSLERRLLIQISENALALVSDEALDVFEGPPMLGRRKNGTNSLSTLNAYEASRRRLSLLLFDQESDSHPESATAFCTHSEISALPTSDTA